MGGWWGQYSFRCQPVDYTDNPTAIRVSWPSFVAPFSRWMMIDRHSNETESNECHLQFYNSNLPTVLHMHIRALLPPYSGTNGTSLCQDRRTFHPSEIEGWIFLEVKVKMLQNMGIILEKYDKQVLTLKIYVKGDIFFCYNVWLKVFLDLL